MRVALVGLALTIWMGLCIGGDAPAWAGESPTAFWLAQQSCPNCREIFQSYSKPAAVRASWYGGGEYLNARTATGERFIPSGHTAAHLTLPFGTRLEVINLANGRKTVVRINDRGPAAWTGRALDLARGAAADLGMIGPGVANVSYRIVN